jgi:ABC-type Fe3+/spermidine/putrescine transport system ATPase subunit
MTATILELTDIHKHYQNGDTTVRALDGVSLSIKRGEFVAIMTIRLGEIHVDEHHRLSRPADLRELSGVGQRSRESFAGRARGITA